MTDWADWACGERSFLLLNGSQKHRHPFMKTGLSSSIFSREGSEPGLCLLNIVPSPFKRSLRQFCLLLSSLKIFAYLVNIIAMLIIFTPSRCSVVCCLFTLLLLPSIAPTARISKTLILVVNFLLCILDLGVCSLDIFPDLTLLGLQ